MENMQKAVLIIHTLIALGIIALVLLQRGKGADAGAAFGAGASGTVFGARGSGSFFSRMTAILATVFFATSLFLAYLSSQQAEAPESLLETVPAVEEETAGDDAPALPEETTEGDDMPSLDVGDEAVDEAGQEADLPALDEELPAPEGSQ